MSGNLFKTLVSRVLKELYADKLLLGAAITLSIIVFVSIAAPVLAPYNPWVTLRTSDGTLAQAFPPSIDFPLGTTFLARDVLSQVLYAGADTLLIGFVASIICVMIGINVGMIAGYYGGIVDEVLMRFVDLIYMLLLLS